MGRAGLHTGEAQERDGDYFGPPVNRAAGIIGASHGGQIALSRSTAELLEARTDVELVDLGDHRLKGLADKLRIFAARVDGVEWVDRPLTSTIRTPG